MKNDRIIEVFDAVKPNGNLKEKIMSTIESEEDVHRCHRKYMAKKVFRNIRNIAAIVMVVLISSVSIYGSGAKSLEEFFFGDSYDATVVESVVHSKKKFWIDGYIITMKEYLVQQEKRQIYMVLEVKKNDGIPEVEDTTGQIAGFGENGRFRMASLEADVDMWGDMLEGSLFVYVHVDAAESELALDKVAFLEDTQKQDSKYPGCYKRYFFDFE